MNYEITPLDDIMPHLLKWIDEPHIVEILKSFYSWILPDRNLPDSSDWNLFFRFGEDIYNDILLLDKPWLKYPLCVIAPVESVDSTRKYIGTDKEPRFESMREDVEELDLVYRKAVTKGFYSPEWWCLPHICYDINGKFLLTLLRLTYPEKHYMFAKISVHAWIYDVDEKKNLDLYYGALDNFSLADVMGADEVVQLKENPDPGDFCTNI